MNVGWNLQRWHCERDEKFLSNAIEFATAVCNIEVGEMNINPIYRIQMQCWL